MRRTRPGERARLRVLKRVARPLLMSANMPLSPGHKKGMNPSWGPSRAAVHSRQYGTIRRGMIPSVRSSDMSEHKKPHTC